MRKIASRKLTFGTLAAILLAGGAAAMIASGHGATPRPATAATLALDLAHASRERRPADG